VKCAGPMAVLLLMLSPWPAAHAHPVRNFHQLDRTNRHLHGQVLDFTRNHGADRRIYSPALCERRDLYVYLPPHFDPQCQYPLILWLHGFAEDEGVFLREVVEPLDRAMACGILPPAIVAAPDGSVHGIDCLLSAGSFYLNSAAGRFEDFLMIDIWGFLRENFPIRPEPQAHAIVGVSMGGGAAFNKAFKFPDHFRIAVGLFPALNIRWMDCHGRYMANFDPCCWGWRTDFEHRHVVIGRFAGVFTIHLRQVISPLFPRGNPNTLPEIIANNPIEMLESYDVQPCQFALYVAYGGHDQFNIDAQVESFLYVARHRGIEVGVGYDPRGGHDRRTAEKLMPDILRWLGCQLAPFGPTAPSCPQAAEAGASQINLGERRPSGQ
jgi:pimeloyl-ACP methyl ester carboxylesterase